MRNRSKGFKEVNACVPILQEIQASGALDPRQKERLRRAIIALKKVKREDPRSNRQCAGAVRVIVEVLWEAFSRKRNDTRAE